MTKEQFSNVMNSIDDALIVNARVDGTAKRKLPRKPLGAIAACLCLMLAAVICIRTANADGAIIANYSASGTVDALYPIPAAGECIFVYEVEQARKAYAEKNVNFLVAFTVYSGNDVLAGEELDAEYRRLAGLGYKLYYVEDHWTYRGKGEKEYIPIVVGLFSEDQLSAFDANERYGYIFRFETNGDGSAIAIDEKNAIAQFNSVVA